MTGVVRQAALGVVLAALAAACAPKTAPAAAPGSAAPRYSSFPTPDVPASLGAAPELVAMHEAAWRRLQSGDLRAAEREFTAIIRLAPGFYPGEAGLGFVFVADREFRRAAAEFSSALGRNDRYLPAWLGQAEAQIGLNNDAGAIAALERVLAIDPNQEAAKSRLELLRFRNVQTLVENAKKAREAGRLDEALTQLQRALALAPSGVILRELALVEAARGSLDTAETHARRAVELDPKDAEALAALGAVLEAKGRTAEAAAAFAAAARLDPRSAWTDRAERLREKATTTDVPPEFRALPSAESVTRAQLAALLGMRLEPVLAKAPRRPASIATDVRGHWAESWILAVTQAGIMDVSPSHTFQPSATIRRSDLANVVSQALTIIAADRRTELAAWRAARPRFVDLPASNVYYPAAALAVAAGAMKPMDGARFASTRPASGADILAAVARLEEIAGR
jgi:tetratricopeptide (TPR) repeat protein